MKLKLILLAIVGFALFYAGTYVEAAPAVEGASTPAMFNSALPSDCFHRVVSYSRDYATATCGYVPPLASFREVVTCKDSWHNFTIYGFRQWFAYHDSTAQCPGGSQMIGAYIAKTAGG